MTRFQRLAAATVITTLVLVTIGVVVRVTNSGMGCPTWPGCFPGQFLPGLDAGFSAWAEWVHRTVAALIGLLILGLAGLALLDHADRASIFWPSFAAVGLALFQAWLGEETVRLGNSGPSVTAHLAAAMAVLGLVVYLLVRAAYPNRLPARGSSQRFTLLAAFTAATSYALLLFGSNVTAAGTALVFPDWPLMNGSLFPALTDADTWQVLHRYVAAIVGLLVVGTWWVARRSLHGHPRLVQAYGLAVALYGVQVVVGGLQVLTRLASWTQAVHVAVGASTWALLVGLAVASYYSARTTDPATEPAGEAPGGAPAGGGTGAGEGPGAAAPGGAVPGAAFVAHELWASGPLGDADPDGLLTGATSAATTAPGAANAPSAAASDAPVAWASADAPAASAARAHTRMDSVRAYIALTKPRIIELLLVTTVPAMVLATRDMPGTRVVDWAWLAVWTMVGGSLAAGSANAINCYLDRDIDQLMTRTRRRPLPANEVDPNRAVIFGIALGVVSFAVMAYYVNLLSAFLTLLAIGFYVFVYTMVLKRTTPQNIVIGGAAGALPPVIGWAAVTGNVGLPAIFLFALVFYWTPPHFWALALRIRKDYAAAGVPMLPVVKGIPETTRQIGLYTILLVTISLAFAAVAGMGLIYVVSAVVLGAIFLFQAWRLWRVGTSEERSTAGAIRLYKYSISYLTLLFVAVAVDALVAIPIG